GGHTDSQGRESSNMALSQSRADAVVDALLTQGLDTVYLRAVGFGETQPIADNETEDGRAQNRRIAFRLLEDEARSEVTSITIGTEAASSGSEPGAVQGTDATGQELIVIGNPQDGPPKLEADAVVTQSEVPLPRPESLSTPGEGAQEDDNG
ncbi:MAG: OmpA family protein, partial [Pseudomonadota bacterium]